MSKGLKIALTIVGAVGVVATGVVVAVKFLRKTSKKHYLTEEEYDFLPTESKTQIAKETEACDCKNCSTCTE